MRQKERQKGPSFGQMQRPSCLEKALMLGKGKGKERGEFSTARSMIWKSNLTQRWRVCEIMYKLAFWSYPTLDYGIISADSTAKHNDTKMIRYVWSHNQTNNSMVCGISKTNGFYISYSLLSFLLICLLLYYSFFSFLFFFGSCI